MIIGSHNYAIAELEFYRFSSPTWDMIGGHLNDVGGVMTQADDFWIRWNRDSLTPFDFGYASSQTPGIWFSAIYNPVSFISFNISSIPEPTTTPILIIGTMIVLAWRHGQR